MYGLESFEWSVLFRQGRHQSEQCNQDDDDGGDAGDDEQFSAPREAS